MAKDNVYCSPTLDYLSERTNVWYYNARQVCAYVRREKRGSWVWTVHDEVDPIAEYRDNIVAEGVATTKRNAAKIATAAAEEYYESIS